MARFPSAVLNGEMRQYAEIPGRELQMSISGGPALSTQYGERAVLGLQSTTRQEL